MKYLKKIVIVLLTIININLLTGLIISCNFQKVLINGVLKEILSLIKLVSVLVMVAKTIFMYILVLIKNIVNLFNGGKIKRIEQNKKMNYLKALNFATL